MRTVRINGEIDRAAAERLRRDLVDAHGDLVVEIDSPGGSFVAALRMLADLQEYRGKTTARVIRALSAATLPLCGCTEAVNTATGSVMIHLPTAAAVADVGLSIGDMQQAIGSLKRTTSILAAIYAAKNSMGWPTHRAVGVYKMMMAREGGTTWGPGGTPPLCDRCEKPATVRATANSQQEAVPAGLLGEIAMGALRAGARYGAQVAVATIAKRDGRPRWCRATGEAFGS
jgi:hypothetical protein